MQPRTEQETSALEVQGLDVERGGEPVLREVSFGIFAGSRSALIGPNGAGKTTLLEALAGLLPAARGTVCWRGAPLPTERRKGRIFHLPDGIAPFGEQRASHLLGFFREVHGQDGAWAAHLVRSLALEGALGKRVGALSKGNRKRLLLALAFLTVQPLLLLDEPVDGLDLHQVSALGELLEEVQARGRTLLLSIHELALAQRLCGDYLLLAEGRLLGHGDLVHLRELAGLEEGGLAEVFLALT